MNDIDETDYYINRIQNDLSLNKNITVKYLGKKYKDNREGIFNGRYIDGGIVKMLNEDYQAIYNFEFDYEMQNSNLIFMSFNEKSGLSFLKFINTLFLQKSEDFVKLDGLVLKDIRKKLKDVRTIKIKNSDIDYTLTKILLSYFPKLRYLEFYNCKILSSASFSNYKIEEIKMKNCIIENTLSLKDSESSLYFYYTKILKIYPVNINVDSIRFSEYELNQINIKELFLKCSFPELRKLSITPFEKYDNSAYYEKSFLFLPYSAPNLEELFVDGKVYSLDFLEKFKKLIYFNLRSEYTDTDIELWYPYIVNKEEKDKISKIYKTQIEEYKKRFSYTPEKYISTIVEIKNILSHTNTLRLLDVTEKEKNILLSNKNLIEYNLSIPSNFKVREYFKAKYDRLDYYKEEEPEGLVIRGGTNDYEIRENILFNNINSNFRSKIMQAKKFIYHISGLPIFIEEYYKPKKIDEIPVYESKDLSDEEDKINEFYTEIKDMPEVDISISDFKEIFEIASLYLPSAAELSKIDKEFANYFYRYEREQAALKNIKNKHYHYLKLINSLIYNIYDDLTFEEKAYIIVNVEIDDFLFNQNYKTEDYVCYITDEEKILDSLNKKTNDLFSKYLNILKETKKQYYSDYHNYSKTTMIPKQLITKLKKIN